MNCWTDAPVLVTGGAGFIGSNLVHRLVMLGASVVVMDAMHPEMGGNPHNLQEIRGDIQWHCCSIANPAMLDSLPSFDYIFNIAGQVSHQDSMREPLFDLLVNVSDQLAFLEWVRCKQINSRLVYTSTRQIYGVPQYVPVDEKHPIQPPDINGVHKLATEQYYQLYSRVYGLKAVSLRLTNTYGPRQLIRHARQGFIAWFIRQALLDGKIELYGGGAQLRDFTFVDDVVDALLLAATSPGCQGEVYNLSGEVSSLADVAAMLKQIAQSEVDIVPIPFPEERKKIDIGSFYGTSEKFYQATGWQTRTSLRSGLQQTVEFFRSHGQHYL